MKPTVPMDPLNCGVFTAGFQHLPFGIAEIGPDFRLRAINRAFAEMFLAEPELLLGRDIRSLLPGHDEAFLSQPGICAQRQFLRSSGEAAWAEIQTMQLPASDGEGPVLLLVFEDITVRRHADERARRLERQFRLLVETSPAGVVQSRRDGTVLHANNAFFSMLGWTQDEFTRAGHTMRTITPPEWLAHSDAHIDSTLELNGAVAYEKQYLRRDGTRVPVSVALSRDASDTDSLLSFALDLSAGKAIEARLRSSEQKLKFAQSVAGAGMYEVDLSTGRLEWTPENCKLFGVPPGTPVSVGFWHSMIAPEDRDRVVAAREAALASGVDLELEYRIVRADGTERWLATRAGIVRNDNGSPTHLIGLNFDITARKASEIAAADSALRIRRIADAMPQIVWTSDADLNITYYNRRWYEYTGAALEDTWRSMVHPDDLPRVREVSSIALSQGKPYQLECRLRSAAGAYCWHLLRAIPLRDDSGEIVEWVGTSTDVDDHRRLRDELEERVLSRTADLRQSITDKEGLLREVQHRVKNNLQVICSLVAMQIDSAMDNSRLRAGVPLLREAQGRVYAIALVHQQAYLSGDILNFDTAAFVEPLAEQLFEIWKMERRRVTLHCSPEVLPLPASHAAPCGLLINELLSNALAHAFPAGEGTISVSLNRGGEQGTVRLAVSDSGVGLPSGFEVASAPSLGFQIVNAMRAQLRASLQVLPGPGTSIVVEWQP